MVQLSDKQKYEIIIRKEDGWSNRKIAKHMKINRKSVDKWTKRYKDTHSIVRNNGSGRKRKTDTKGDKILINLAEKECTTINEIKHKLEEYNI